jgi:hypothetical protein
MAAALVMTLEAKLQKVRDQAKKPVAARPAAKKTTRPVQPKPAARTPVPQAKPASQLSIKPVEPVPPVKEPGIQIPPDFEVPDAAVVSTQPQGESPTLAAPAGLIRLRG